MVGVVWAKERGQIGYRALGDADFVRAVWTVCEAQFRPLDIRVRQLDCQIKHLVLEYASHGRIFKVEKWLMPISEDIGRFRILLAA